MSVEIISKVICDSCGHQLVSSCDITTYAKSWHDVKRLARKERWLFQYRYGKTKHLCAACADGKPVPVLERYERKLESK